MKMPEIHAFLDDHLIASMEQFLEDFIEQAHQFGMKEEKRTANMRDRVEGELTFKVGMGRQDEQCLAHF
jgi:hypothetical protein